MAYSGNMRRILRVRVVSSTIHKIEDSSDGILEGFIICREIVSSDETDIQNQNVPRNSETLTWRVLVPHDLVNGNTLQPSPAYEAGDILYVARLDTPVVIDTSSSDLLPNNHPLVNEQLGVVQLVPHKPSMAGHYDKASIDPANDCVFWIDLNVDGRTRGGGGGGGGSASVVWL